MKKKHRLYIDVTFSKSVSARRAAQGLRLFVSDIDLNANPVWLYEGSPYIDKIKITEKQR